jgi:hypothetical protein
MIGKFENEMHLLTNAVSPAFSSASAKASADKAFSNHQIFKFSPIFAALLGD